MENDEVIKIEKMNDALEKVSNQEVQLVEKEKEEARLGTAKIAGICVGIVISLTIGGILFANYLRKNQK